MDIEVIDDETKADPGDYTPETEAAIERFMDEFAEVEVGGDLEAAVAEEKDLELAVANAAGEGMVAVPPPTVPSAEPDPESDPVAEWRRGVFEEERIALRIATDEMYTARDRLKDAVSEFERKDKISKAAKKYAETCQDLVNASVDHLREVENAGTPNPAKFPLFDRPKEPVSAPTTDPAKVAINEMFAPPVAIQPTPPEDFAEFLRRKQRDTPIAHLGLTIAVEKVVGDDLGMKTVLDLVNKFSAVAEGGAQLTTIKGVTTKRLEAITEALAMLTEDAQKEWDALHPAEAREDAEDIAEAERRLTDPDDATISFEDAVKQRDDAETD